MSQPYLILLVAQQDLTISLSICDFSEMSQTSLNFHDIHSQGFCISLYFMLDQMFSTKCRKKTSLAKYNVLLSVDSFFPRNMELFPGVTLHLHTTVIHAFLIKRFHSLLGAYLVSFSAHVVRPSNVLGPPAPCFNKTLVKGTATLTEMKDQFSERALLIIAGFLQGFFLHKLSHTSLQSLILRAVLCIAPYQKKT